LLFLYIYVNYIDVMIKKCVCILLILLIVALVFVSLDSDTIPEETGTIDVYFCQQDNCQSVFFAYVENATTIDCAFYDMDEEVLDKLAKKDVRIVLEKDNKMDGNIIYDDRSAYMHNKFCIFDHSIVMTGSMNPTSNGFEKNDNNLVFIESQSLVANYEAEFESFVRGDFGGDNEVEYPNILFNGHVVENYFCPEDYCEKRIVDVLHLANESIYFMQFSFTSDVIGDLLLAKSLDGVGIKGIFEKQQNSQWSKYQKLSDAGLNVSFAETPGKMHHKVFIVDEKIVIFGSMNPSKNGDVNNDENVLIVHDEGVAEMFLEEFERIDG
jgi:phosphatidylserine/phosphatidylglycerophosphate/cardiolipin synthase-like enzyme